MPGEGAIASMFVSLAVSNSASPELNKVDADFKKAETSGKSLADKVGILSGSFASMGHFVDRAMNMMDRYEISQLTVSNATNNAMDAQLRYNQAVAKYGESSGQAQMAARNLENAQNNLDKANIRAQSSMVLMGVSALSMVPQLITAGNAIVAFARTGQIAIGGLTLTMSTLAPWVVGIGAALSVAYYLFSRNAEAAYNLSTQQQALALSAEEYNMATSSMFSLLSPLEAAQGTLAEKQIAAKKAFDDWQKAVEEFGENSPEAVAAYARYRQAAEELAAAERALIKTQEDLSKSTSDTSSKMDAATGNWKTAFKNTVIDIGSSLWGLASTIGSALDNIIQNWYTKWTDLESYSDQVWFLISNYAKIVFPGIGDIIIGVWETAYNKAHEVWDTLLTYLPTSWDEILTKAEQAFEDIKNAIIGPFQAAYNFVYGIWQDMTSWSWSPGASASGSGGGGSGYYSPESVAAGNGPGGGLQGASGSSTPYGPMAEGGIVTRPTFALIGEAGPEAVIPLRRGGFGGGVTVQVNFNGAIYGVDDLNSALDSAIERLQWRIRSMGG